MSNCKICDVTTRLGRGLRNETTCDKDGGGVKKIMKFVWRNLWMAPYFIQFFATFFRRSLEFLFLLSPLALQSILHILFDILSVSKFAFQTDCRSYINILKGKALRPDRSYKITNLFKVHRALSFLFNKLNKTACA